MGVIGCIPRGTPERGALLKLAPDDDGTIPPPDPPPPDVSYRFTGDWLRAREVSNCDEEASRKRSACEGEEEWTRFAPLSEYTPGVPPALGCSLASFCCTTPTAAGGRGAMYVEGELAKGIVVRTPP